MEGCDDGNLSNADECLTTCVPASCGDGFVQAGEACDDGNGDNTDSCLSTCVVATCGDGFVRAGVEACDDGNESDADGCTTACALPSCGDGVVEEGVEACDDGNLVNTDDCLVTCLEASCGDGFVQAGIEQCDDGNLVDGDWCSSTCQRECLLGEAAALDGSSCYMLFVQPMSWLDAAATCGVWGSHLVVLSSAEENAAVLALVDGAVPSVWTALSDQWSEGTFVWSLAPGQVLAPTYTNWNVDGMQPDNGPAGNGDCAAFDAATGLWSDEACGGLRPFVCEYDFQQ